MNQRVKAFGVMVNSTITQNKFLPEMDLFASFVLCKVVLCALFKTGLHVHDKVSVWYYELALSDNEHTISLSKYLQLTKN